MILTLDLDRFKGGRSKLFHPAARVAEAEAFLARRITVVHLCAPDVEPAQRSNEHPRAFSASVRDVGFIPRR